MKNQSSVLRIIATVVLVALFCAAVKLAGLLSALSIALMTIFVGLIILKFANEITSKHDANVSEDEFSAADLLTVKLLPLKPSKRDKSMDYFRIVCFILIVRIATYIFAYITSLKMGITEDSFFGSFNKIWLDMGTDAPHYIGIAENWYVTEGDPMYHIVFFPFFPIMIKLFSFVFRDMLLSAVMVTTVFSCGAGLAAYELCLLDFDRKTALRFVKYMFIIPAAFFYCAPMTESMFIFLCLMCIYFARKSRFLLCAVFGALAAFTRSQGAILMLPCAIIALTDTVKAYRNDKKLLWKKLISRWACVLLIASGLLAYLGINYAVWGNALQFSVFQKEHWFQSFGFFFNTAELIGYCLLHELTAANAPLWSDSSFRMAISLWLPQLIYIFASLIVMIFAAKKLKSAYTAFFAAYFIISIGATWLLSAPRYLMAVFSLPMALARLTDSKKKDLIATVTCLVTGSSYLWMYAASSAIF